MDGWKICFVVFFCIDGMLIFLLLNLRRSGAWSASLATETTTVERK